MKNDSVNISIPAYVREVLSRLEEQGFEAFLAGGCVRDSIIGKVPVDWDITTDALPEQVITCFGDYRVVPTGIRHGTVTVVMDSGSIEITTYRIDGDYSDSRHPDSVSFTGNLRDDMARRDFTMNAIAYNPKYGMADYYGGLADIDSKLICCVGNPGGRFREDALRILRAARFASVLGYKIEEATKAAMLEFSPLLDNIARERCYVELLKSLCGDFFSEIFLVMPEILTAVIPELIPCIGFEQKNHAHIYTVYEHIVRACAAIPPDPVLRLTMLFHDIGKPECFTSDSKGVGHFRGHADASVRMASAVLNRLRADNATIGRVEVLIKYHDAPIVPELRNIKRWLNRIGVDAFRQLILVQRADNSAKNPEFGEKKKAPLPQAERLLEQIIEEGQCFSLKDLAINGTDLIGVGINSGPELGKCLNHLLDIVISGEIENNAGDLIREAHRYNSDS